MKDITKMEFAIENLSFGGNAKPRETEKKTSAIRQPVASQNQNLKLVNFFKNCKETNNGQVPLKPFRLAVPRTLPRRFSGSSPGRRDNLYIQRRWDGMSEQRVGGRMDSLSDDDEVALLAESIERQMELPTASESALLLKSTKRKSCKDPQAFIPPRTYVRHRIFRSTDGERASGKRLKT